MALLSSLSLALLKDKKAKGKAPAVPVFGNEVKPSSAQAVVQRSVGDHERPGLGALSRCAPAPIAANGNARVGGVIVASPITFPRTSSASSSSPAPVASPPRPPSPQRSKSQGGSQQSPSAGSAAAVGSFLAAYSDSDDEDDDRESSEVAKSTPPKQNDSILQPKHHAQTNGKSAMEISSSSAMVEEGLDDEFDDDEDIDGEGLTTAELMPVAHLCGPGAWRWSAEDKRKSSRGPRLGSHNWTIDASKAEEDPDLEDFAFLSEIASIEKDLAVELGTSDAENMGVPPPPESAPPPEPTDNEDLPPIPQEPPEAEEVRPSPPSDDPLKGKAESATEAQAQSIGQKMPDELATAQNAQSELSAGRRIAEQLRQADEPYRREQERRREEEQRRRQAEEEEEKRRIEERRREREEDRRRAEKRRAKEEDRYVKRPKEEDRKIAQVDEATKRREEKMRRVEIERRQIEEQRKQKEDAERRAAQLDKQKKKAQEDWVNKCADSSRSDSGLAKRTKGISFGSLSSTHALTSANTNASANASLIASAIANANARASVGAGFGKADTKEEVTDKSVQERRSSSTLQPPTTLSELLRQAGPEPKHESKDVVTVGWLPTGHTCGSCNKGVVRNGGVFCGRRRSDGSLAGCFAGVCWKCMSKAPCESFGNIRTTKSEFSSLGADAWWMHEGCMSATDLKDYNCEDEEHEPQKAEDSKREHGSVRKKSKEKQTKSFAWE